MVSYGAQHLLFRVHGVFGPLATDPRDIWGIGLRVFTGASPLGEAGKEEFLDGMVTPTVNLHRSANNRAPSSCWLTEISAAYIGLDGKYVGGASQPTTKYVWPTPVNGTGDATMPYSHARVYTLRTNIDRGRGSVGRVYYPSGRGVDSSGLWTAAECGLAAGDFATFANAINAVARAIWSPASAVSVFSGMGTSEIGFVTRVQVGRAPDTQRRRDNALSESYQEAAITSTADWAAEVSTRTYS